MLGDCFALVMEAVNSAWAVMEQLFYAIPGFLQILIAMFFIAIVLGLLIMPLRGGGSITPGKSDGVLPPRDTGDPEADAWYNNVNW